MSVTLLVDRSMLVQPGQIVRTAWIDIDLCQLGCRDRMAPEAVGEKWRRLLQQGDGAPWPCPIGHWSGDRFTICDGRHEYLASLMMGRTQIFVAWLSPAAAEPALGDLPRPCR